MLAVAHRHDNNSRFRTSAAGNAKHFFKRPGFFPGFDEKSRH
jgi:hypothetical protein